jgi:hypothetical protein
MAMAGAGRSRGRCAAGRVAAGEMEIVHEMHKAAEPALLTGWQSTECSTDCMR